MKRLLLGLISCLVIISLPLLLSGCGGEDMGPRNRIQHALDIVEIRAGGRSHDWIDFVAGDRQYPQGIDVEIDFRRVLTRAEVQSDDFRRVSHEAQELIDGMYRDLGLMFSRTDHLTIRELNVDYLLDNFEMPPDLQGMDQFPIEIGRFLETPDKFLSMLTHYGNLDVPSEFFFGRPDPQGRAPAFESDLRLIFAYEGDAIAVHGDSIIRLEVENEHGDVRNKEHPGRSALITLPLSLDFMTDAQGNLLYNAVAYIDIFGNERGVLPRSFVAGNNLYVYLNRTGRFRLTPTPHGNTTNRSHFLSDRGITFQGIEHGGERIVTRGEFYEALMHIHWVEQLHFDRPIQSFIDVPMGGSLEAAINIGQNLTVRIGPVQTQVLTGFPDGLFRTHDPLRRSHMFRMLAGNIEYFGFEIDGLLHFEANAVGMPDNPNVYYYHYLNYLVQRRFIPFRRTAEGIADAAPYAYVTVQEAENILFLLITAGHFD